MGVGKGKVNEFSARARVNHAGHVNGVLVKDDSARDAHGIVLHIHNKYTFNCNS